MLTSSKLLAALFIATTTLVGCGRKQAFMDYAQIPHSGWQRADSVTFSIDSVSADGDYRLQLGVRADNSYPYTDLWVAMTRKIFPRETEHHDTIRLSMVSSTGHWRGDGVNVYQYLFDIDTLYLNRGDSVALSFKHIMRRDSLPGISDIGIELTRDPNSP